MICSLPRLLGPAALVGLSLLGSSDALAVTQNVCSFPPALTSFAYNGNAFSAQNGIRLTTATAAETSSAFLTTPVALGTTTSFHAFFRFQMGPSTKGGDGLSFVLHNSSLGAAALGSSVAAGMGYSTLSPSVVVEFDTFKNGTGDPNANHVGVLLNGSYAVHAATATPPFTMAGGGVLNAWVDYDAVGSSLNVYLALTATKPTSALLTFPINLVTALGSQMFVGFSSATGTANAGELNQHDVFALEFSTDGVPCLCEGDDACGGTTPACVSSGLCGVCSATNHSGCTGSKPVCNVPVNTCVGCLSNTDCANPSPICDKATLMCGGCKTKADCGGSTPQCAPSGSCVACVVHADCPPQSPRCAPSNTCVQCLVAADCGGDTPICSGGLCRACANDSECGGTTPACQIVGNCGQCSPSNASACAGLKRVCDYPTGTCVACEFNSDCSGATPTCDGPTHTCKACQSNADCANNSAGSACATTGSKAGTCVGCTTEADCAGTTTPRCDTVASHCVSCLNKGDCAVPTPVCNNSHLCVACLADADCSDVAPVCDVAASTCRPCQNDYAAAKPGPFACPTALAPACQPTGSPLAGRCGLCSSLSFGTCATQAATPVCIPTTATCGCAKDTDCSAGSYCETSTTRTGSCKPGCKVVGGLFNCATGEYCSVTDGTVGSCTTEVCNRDADCAAPTPTCNTLVQPYVCVQCLNKSDCASGQVCDAVHHCVECTPNQIETCRAFAKGGICLATETCGCASDTDCSDSAVCDDALHTCVTGCRGIGSHGCAAPLACSSTNSAVGTCQPPSASSSSSSSSGGAGGAGGAGPRTAHLVTQSLGAGCGVSRGREKPSLGGLALLLAGLGVLLRRRSNANGSTRP